jgi:hypothetical protein
MKRMVIFAGTVLAAAASLVSAEMKISPSVAVQLTRNGLEDNENALNDAFIRGEVKFRADAEQGAGGMLHLRLQNKFMEGKELLSIDIKQAYLEMPVSALKIILGRWYEIYTPGAFFGRYLYEADKLGNGAMKTNYSVLDGVRFHLDLPDFLGLGVFLEALPGDFRFENLYTAARFTISPIAMIAVGGGANIEVNDISSNGYNNRFAFTAKISPMEAMAFFAEIAYTEFGDDDNAVWVMGGADIPSAKILDVLRLEIEYTPERNTGQDDVNLAWMILVGKKIAGVAFELNVGADPNTLKSKSVGDVGAILRTTVKF